MHVCFVNEISSGIRRSSVVVQRTGQVSTCSHCRLGCWDGGSVSSVNVNRELVATSLQSGGKYPQQKVPPIGKDSKYMRLTSKLYSDPSHLNQPYLYPTEKVILDCKAPNGSAEISEEVAHFMLGGSSR